MTRINSQIHNTLASLAKVYGLSSTTFLELIEEIEDELELHSSVLSPNQIMRIEMHLGSPDIVGSVDPLALNTNSKLANYYNVSPQTFRKWIEPITELKARHCRRKYIPKEVFVIVGHLGFN